MLSVNSISHVNRAVNNRSQNKMAETPKPLEQTSCDTVCFKGKNKSASNLFQMFAKMLGGGVAVGAGMEYFNQTSQEDIAREDFKTMKNMTGFWLDKYSYQPEILEKLLLECDDFKGLVEPRLFHVSQEKVTRIFSKDEDALKRIYTIDNIVDIELKNFKNNKYGQSLIELLGEKCPNILDSVMFQENEYDDSTLLSPVRKFINTERTNAHCLEHLNKAYKNRLDTLAKIYLLKDNNQKYPLHYVKNLPQDVQDKIMENIRYTFESRPDLLMPILESSGFEDYANKIKEEDANKPLTLLKQTGLSEDTINETLTSLDENTKNELLEGLNNRKIYNFREEKAIKELFDAIYRQTKDEKTATEMTFKLLAQFFNVSKDFDSNKEISFYQAIKDIKENGIKIIDTKKLTVDRWGSIEYEYPDRTVLKKTDDIFEYIDDKTKNRIVEHIGRYPMSPDKADKIETYDEHNNLIKEWDEFGDVTRYYSSGRLIKRVTPHAVEHFDEQGRSDKEGGWADW